jgi:hypothetical protein
MERASLMMSDSDGEADDFNRGRRLNERAILMKADDSNDGRRL